MEQKDHQFDSRLNLNLTHVNLPRKLNKSHRYQRKSCKRTKASADLSAVQAGIKIKLEWAQARAHKPRPVVKPIVNKVTTSKSPGPKAQ